MARNKAKGNGEGSVFETPSGTWRWQLTHYEGLKRVTRSGTEANRSEARKALANAISQRQKLGTLTAPDKKTLGLWLDEWLERKRPHVRLNTFVGYASDIRRHIKPAIGHLKLQAIKPIDLRSFYTDLANKKVALSGRGKRKNEKKEAERTLSASSLRQIHSIIYSALQEALELEIIYRNVAQVVKPSVKVSDRNAKASTAWTAEEASRFLSFAKADRLYPLFYLMLSLGLRRGEVAGLRWENVDLTNGRIRIVETIITVTGKVHNSKPKTEKSRRVLKLSPDLVEVLTTHKEAQRLEHEALGVSPTKDWVFTSLTGEAFNPDNINRIFNAIRTTAEVRKVRLHDLRHTHASLARRQGVSLEVVSARLGHTRSSFTADVYRHTFEDEIEEAAIPLSSLLAAPKRIAN